MKRTFILFLILLSFVCNAQIGYTDVDPDKAITSNGAGVFEAFELKNGEPGSQIELMVYGNEAKIRANTNVELMTDGNYPLALKKDDVISASSLNWQNPTAPFGKGLWDGSSGQWANLSDRYLGARFEVGGLWYYGWVLMDVWQDSITMDKFSITLKAYAYNTQAGDSVLAGQIFPASASNITQEDMKIKVLPWKKVQVRGIPDGSTYNLVISNMSGQFVYKQLLTSDTTIDMNSFTSGIYVVGISAPTLQISYKVYLY